MRERRFLARQHEVVAILAERLTQFRRPVKQAFGQCGSGMGPVARVCEPCDKSGFRAVYTDSTDPNWRPIRRPYGHGFPCPFGVPGDRLWVAEAWGIGTRPDPNEGWRDGIEYRADAEGLEEHDLLPLHSVDLPDGVDLDDLNTGWRPSVNMPKWAANIWLEVTGVRVERVQDASINDGFAEGACTRDEHHEAMDAAAVLGLGAADFPLQELIKCWDSTAKPGLTYADNPWNWIVGVKVVMQNRTGKDQSR